MVPPVAFNAPGPGFRLPARSGQGYDWEEGEAPRPLRLLTFRHTGCPTTLWAFHTHNEGNDECASWR